MNRTMNEQTLELPKEGDRVGTGTITDLISVGGTARVYRILVTSLEIYRAVKIMNPEATQDVRDRFSTEAKITAKLSHPNIVQIFNYGETASGLPYIEMEHVDGPTLEDVLRKRGALPLPVAVAVSIGVLEAVNYAHNINYTFRTQPLKGIMHRDIKPGNIVFATGTTKLMDFGIARPATVSIHTVAGDLVGTVPYLAPEYCTGGNSDFRSDIYQVGLLIYECINGSMAYPQTDIGTVVEAIKTGQREPLNTSNKVITAIVGKCLELDPAKRYQTAADCLADVKALYHSISPRTTPEAQISAFLLNTTPTPTAETPPPIRADHATAMSGTTGTRKLKIAATAILALLLAVGFALFGAKYLNLSTDQSPAATPVAATPAAEPPQPPPTAATSTPQPQTAQAKPKPTAAPTQTPAPARGKQDVRDSRDIRDIQDIRDSKDTPPPPRPEDAQTLIAEAKKLLGQNNAQEALAKYQQALKTPSATLARSEIVRLSIYGSAKCNTILFNDDKIPRANYEASWRSVQSTYPAGSPEHSEAAKHLDGAIR